jgi:hypothetical protein
MSKFFARLAGSKLLSYSGLLLLVLGVVCGTNRQEIVELVPRWGPKICSLAVLLGGLISAFGQGIASRRSGARDSGVPVEGGAG